MNKEGHIVSTTTTVRRAPWAWLLPVLALCAITLSGCDVHAPGDTGRLQTIAAECPDRPVNSHIQIDGSGSSQSDALMDERLAIVRTVAERTAVCGGQLTVTVFSAGSGATVTVYSSDLTLNAPTENARLRKVGAVVDSALEEISENISPAIAALPAGGSDIGSSYRLMGEQAAQLPDSVYQGLLITDGLSNLGALQVTGALSTEEAQALASQVAVPTLPADSAIVVAGLGRVVGDPIPSEVIEGMVSLYDALCARSGAGECRSVTDFR